MAEHRIALLPGDGVGPEVTAAARRVLEACTVAVPGLRLAFTEYPAGAAAHRRGGAALPQETLDGILRSSAALLGALAPLPAPLPSPTGLLRRELDLYADVRPVRSLPGVWCLRPDIDLICIRENTEGFLADRNLYKGCGEFMPTPDEVMSLRLLTRTGCRRIARFAFGYARRHGRHTITAVHKANVLREGCGFFLEIVRQTAAEYPDIALTEELVDSVANNLIAAPRRYDVLLATNLFGDIISDEAAALVSSLVPTANIGAACAVFRPVHEALPDQAGHNVVNPLSAILSAAMMLSHLGEAGAAGLVEGSVRQVLAAGVVRTRDLGGESATSEVTAAVCEIIHGDAVKRKP